MTGNKGDHVELLKQSHNPLLGYRMHNCSKSLSYAFN